MERMAAMLQWGRAKDRAEMLQNPCSMVQSDAASMGPRERSRGNFCSDQKLIAAFELQWGRAKDRAEMRKNSPDA